VNIGPPELLIILAILLLLFGASRLPKLARSMGQAGKEFKEGFRQGTKDQPLEGPCPFCGANVESDAKFCAGCGKSADEIVAEKNRVAAEKGDKKEAPKSA
jgi:sec-independent protein translocase protein TatA